MLGTVVAQGPCIDSFTVRTVLTSTGYELNEYQFAGSVEAHRVPNNPHEGHVAITGLGN